MCDLEIAVTEMPKGEPVDGEENDQDGLPSAADIGAEVEKELFQLCGT